MKILIDIPENYYSACKEWKTMGVATTAEEIISNGTPYEENTCDEREKGNCPFYTARGDV